MKMTRRSVHTMSAAGAPPPGDVDLDAVPGTTARLQILHTARVEGAIEVFFQLLNAEGRPATTGGFARIAG